MKMKLRQFSSFVLMGALILSTVGCKGNVNNSVDGAEEIMKRKSVNISGSPNLDYTGQKVGVLTPADKPEYYDGVLDEIKSGVNATVEEIAWNNADTAISAENYDVVIVPDAEKYPTNAAQAIDSYLKNGGKLLTMGGPPLQKGLQLVNGTWMDQEEAFENAEKKTILNFSNASDCEFSLNSDNPGQVNYSAIVEQDAPDGGNAVHITYENPKNWAQAEKTVSVNMTGASSISFYLKGNDVFYTGLSIGVSDGSGSYYAAVKPTSDWKLVSLAEEDFNLWANDTIHYDSHPNLDNIKKISFGISQTHVPFHVGKLHEFWISSPVLQKVGNLGPVSMVLDGIAPEYKFYPITNGETAEASQNQSFVATRKYTLPQELFSPVHRPQGTGFSRNKALRFVPLIEVSDKKGLRSGYLAWMFVNSTGWNDKVESEYESSIIAGFGTNEASFYNNEGKAAVVDVLRTLLNDYMFVEAGATEDIYIDSETKELSLGAYTRGRHTEGLTLNFAFIKNNKSIFNQSFDMSSHRVLKSKGDTEIKVRSFEYSVSNGKPDYIVCTIKKDDKVLDTIYQNITFWSPKPESERKYITIKDNEFIRDGKVLRAYGVNFVPSSSLGAEDDYFWEYYLSPQSFDPDVIYNDLLRLKEVGFNAISTFIYYENAVQAKNMLWFADICDKLGLVISVDIRPNADPFNLVEEEVVETFKTQHLAELDNVIGYDVAWERSFGTYEPNYGNYNGRKAYNKDWIQWVEDNYGSIENAESIWGETMPTDAQGNYIGVSDEALRAVEPSKIVAAYRRFADDMIASKHAYVKELIRRLAPNHIISARAGDSGCIPSADAAQMGYDFTSMAAGLDFLSPEYYAPTEYIDQAIFTNVYSRYASPDAPVVWKEFGARSTWCGSNFDRPEYKTLRETVEKDSVIKFEKFMDAIISAHTGGFFIWFSQGGYRYDEKSDCGVINPDGSDRQLTKSIREYRDKFINQPELAKPTGAIMIDRDWYSNTIRSLYSVVKEPLLSAAKKGETIIFKDASTDKNTDTVSDEAVGGGIAGADNPARWVNGVFQAVYVKASNGEWQQVKYGDSVKIGTGSLEVKIVVTNMMGSEWLSKSASKASYVSLVSTAKSGIKFNLPLKENVRHLETITQEFKLADSVSSDTAVSFRLGIQDRFPFAAPFMFIID